jgi:tRNA-dihydrouridine synthase B
MPKPPPYLYLAPIRGLTDALFRTTLHHHFRGFDAAVAPFINPQRKSLYDDRSLRDVLPENNPGLTVVPQLLHTDPEDFLALVDRLADLGYRLVNWNLGCPAPMVARKKRGSGLLPYPEEILALLRAVLPHPRVELSLKTRLGYHEPGELSALLPELDHFPLREIIIHPRLGRQLYRGSADSDAFADCLTLTRHRLCYNGDIIDAAGYHRLTTRFATVDSWMVGRGALANPFLAEEIKGIASGTAAERRDRLRHFHDDLIGRYQSRLSGPSHLFGRVKQLWAYLIASFPGQERYLKRILKSHRLPDYLETVSELFATPLPRPEDTTADYGKAQPQKS